MTVQTPTTPASTTEGGGYAVVQHSAFGYKADPQFQHALETRHVDLRQAHIVRRAGGVVFATYGEAEDWAEVEQYRDVSGLVPRAPGRFADGRIDGLAIYVPNHPAIEPKTITITLPDGYAEDLTHIVLVTAEPTLTGRVEYAVMVLDDEGEEVEEIGCGALGGLLTETAKTIRDQTDRRTLMGRIAARRRARNEQQQKEG